MNNAAQKTVPSVQLSDVPRTPLAVRAGDLLRVGDDLRMAIRIAELALDLAARGGAPSDEVATLTRLLLELRR